MACSTRPGPQAYLTFIEEVTGHKITQAEWHEMREMAQEDAIRAEYQRLQAEAADDSDLVYGTASMLDEARGNVGSVLTRQRVDRDRAEAAADLIADRVLRDLPATESGDEAEEFRANAKERMQFATSENDVTAGTIATVEGIARRGVRLSVSEARGRIQQKAQHRAEKRDVERASETETDPVMAVGLEKAASLMTEKGDAGVMKWRLSGDMEREYPGLTERYVEITRGSKDARAFAMFSRKGNEAALAATRDMQERILEGKLSRDEVSRAYYDAVERIAAKHPEIGDTEPRGLMQDMLNESLDAAGWKRIDW